ncbi:hypothetical protein SAMN00017405_1669 [Desulfonispora thiosulfatigenes DSM 11270]|uniref:DUF948 domain-containing protein n=1 Tax=Desulfonispora thiosulfatigenes DSM 11270 TaxID=656914 RepID=A0A1W1UX84_DESTI|nr:hypothetical protein [Desulfonispora thiosulfatigenes]SMB85765.1 hypothetical protein SAMN00017405_1669 [Desulfonispora thiosulfatigenes DSM 11270]
MISYKDLGLVILFLISAGLGVYLILTLTQVYAIVKNVRSFLDLNRSNLDQIMDKLPSVVSNVDDAANDLKNGVARASDAVESIGDSITDTVSSVTVGTREAAEYVKIISEIVKVIINTWKK